jgi:hypothetical protein
MVRFRAERQGDGGRPSEGLLKQRLVRSEVGWYYEALAGAFEAREVEPMAAELRRTVDAIRILVR